MSLGENIKKYRNELNLTQKDLSEKLHVTYQAVSRWENDEVEPSILTLKEMCKIFSCTMDELLGVENKDAVEEDVIDNDENHEDNNDQINNEEESNSSDTTNQVQTPVDNRVAIATCDICGKPLFDAREMKKLTNSKRVRKGAHHHETINTTTIYCDDCYNKKLENDKKLEQKRQINIANEKNLKLEILLF